MTCYIDKDSYNDFSLFNSKNSLINITYDTYTLQNNECQLSEKNLVLDPQKPSSINSNKYCELFIKVELK